MTTQKLRNIYTISLVGLDTVLMTFAFVAAYYVRVQIPWPNELANQQPLVRYAGLIALQVIGSVFALSFYRQYYIPRAISRIDQLYAVFAGISIGTMMAVAVAAFVFKNQDDVLAFDYPRAMVIYAWLFSILLVMLGRLLHQRLRMLLRTRGWDKDRVIIVGAGKTARSILRQISWSPQLGYDVIGIVGDVKGHREIQGVPVLGNEEDLPQLIQTHRIDEVIVAIPERGHRAVVRTVSYCERGRVSIKVVPDVFHFITSEASIDDLGGMPLLTVRDFSIRGYMLILKRIVDFMGAAMGLIVFSPLMVLVALAIKLESPGPAFFVQERMGLDGKPFRIVKFRSMRIDAEKDGPGWTVDNDPRQTKLGSLIRKIEVDELPQFINVLLGEMSLVGPRPEQPHYVERFRRMVPRYMERHREKAGMTGWAQINGLRGDTSIEERTRYDIWYTENWSLLLDFKIVLRTVWQIFSGRTESLDAPLVRQGRA